MHELSIAISMIEQVVNESAIRGGLEIEAVNLRLGVFSGVDKDALLFGYEIACEGTPLEGSRLLIEVVPLVIYCSHCKKEVTPISNYEISCPECLLPSEKIVSGRELEVLSLEVAV